VPTAPAIEEDVPGYTVFVSVTVSVIVDVMTVTFDGRGAAVT